jgi:hypothetical protein
MKARLTALFFSVLASACGDAQESDPPGGGSYKLVAQAGAIFSYQPVTVGFM